MQRELAYLDAGSASMALQVIAGALAAVAVGLKLFWRRILVLLHLRRPAAEPLAAAERPDSDRAPVRDEPTVRP
ncbi:MAG: hypothetical protein JO222_13860 [Frankiales bacterium]|nr:hypothetical protein [Frankiales bacterium]